MTHNYTLILSKRFLEIFLAPPTDETMKGLIDVSVVWFSSPSEMFHTSMLILIIHSEQPRNTWEKKYMKILKMPG